VRSRQPARASEGPPPRRGDKNAFGRPGREHLARPTSQGRFGPPPQAVGLGDLALRIRTLDRKIADLNGRIEAEVEASGTTLTEIFGIGPILAARIIGTVGDVARFPTKGHYFASYAGRAPVEASSGEVVRHRLSRWPATVSSTTPFIWSLPARPGRTPVAGPTTTRRSLRASPERRRCGASRGASQICRLQEPHGGLASAF
jgi:transposase